VEAYVFECTCMLSLLKSLQLHNCLTLSALNFISYVGIYASVLCISCMYKHGTVGISMVTDATVLPGDLNITVTVFVVFELVWMDYQVQVAMGCCWWI